MIVIFTVVGIAIYIYILYVRYSAHLAEERKDKAFVDTWNRNKDMEGYYIYL
jgi:hypothetical protein